MGRTNPTYRDRLGAIEDEWSEYRQVLRRRDQETYDQLFVYARDHADAAGMLNHSDPLAPVWMAIALEQEERIKPREAELEHISAQAELSQQEGRAKRTREIVVEQCGRDKPEPVERTDPREKLTQDELAEVNKQAIRISDEVQGGWLRAVVAKQLAEKVQRGRDVTKAVLETLEELKAAPGAIVPIADVPDVPVGEVTVEGTVQTLWEPSSSAIQQVGLIVGKSNSPAGRNPGRRWCVKVRLCGSGQQPRTGAKVGAQSR